jgi:hypothetical protein
VRSLVLGVALVAACQQQKSQEQPVAAAPAKPIVSIDAAPVAAPAKPRPGGPSEELCEKFTAHVGKFIAEGFTRPGAGTEEKKFVDKQVHADREHTVRFCLEALEEPEITCVLAASDFHALSACERLRRQVPADMLGRNEVNEADCERFFVRHKQFMMGTGVSGLKIEADRDQVIRTCLEKARPGPIACYITAQTYEEARRCQ